ncbi:hypothetical protein [Lysobacter enzymogenes]|nr:hypothetical protein [Lysobacter enzymogenes]UZW62251.1 hypothetical protein BV903_008180 [Lysobacter enzymogenes]
MYTKVSAASVIAIMDGRRIADASTRVRFDLMALENSGVSITAASR